MNWFKKIKASLRYSESVRQADKAFLESGDRHYVMPYTNGKLIIMNRHSFRKLKSKRYITRQSFIKDLERECFYSTPYKSGSKKLTSEEVKHKRKQYFAWVK